MGTKKIVFFSMFEREYSMKKATLAVLSMRSIAHNSAGRCYMFSVTAPTHPPKSAVIMALTIVVESTALAQMKHHSLQLMRCGNKHLLRLKLKVLMTILTL